MQNKNIKTVLLVIFAIGAFVAVTFFYMQEKKESSLTNERAMQNSVTVVSQENNVFTLNLTFDNDTQERSMLKYTVLLYRSDEKGEIVGESPLDVKYYADKISLGESKDKLIKKDISYSAPQYLDGEYILVVEYVNESGRQIKSSIVDKITLHAKNTDFLEIFPDTCILQIEGEKGEKMYTHSQGVDVKIEENLILTCTVTNHFDKEITVNPNFENYFRNFTLGEIREQYKVTFGKIAFAPNQTKNISLPITKALLPQAYDAAFFFTDDSQKQLSNRIYSHYVIVGESATIHDVTLDKNHYSSGEIAKTNIYVSGSADGFEFSRHGGTKNKMLNLEIDIRDINNQSCLNEKKTLNLDVTKTTNQEVSIEVGKDCQKPFILVLLRGTNDEVLDARSFLQIIK